MNNIGIIGTGNMSGSILEGVLSKGYIDASEVYIYNRSLWRNEKYIKDYSEINISKDYENLVKNSKYIIVGVKPHAYGQVLKEIKAFLNEEHVIISIAAGVSILDMESLIGSESKIVRTMPNTPALVLEAMTAITYNLNVSDDEKEFIQNLFDQVGKSEVIEEKLMDIIPSVSGSSPAYVFMFIEALSDGAVLEGMPRDKAYKFAAQAVLGAAKLVLESGKHPGELKDMVTSPGGTTIEAIKTLEENAFRGSIISAMRSCTEKAKKLNK